MSCRRRWPVRVALIAIPPPPVGTPVSCTPRDSRSRLKLLGLFGLLVFIALGVRLFWIQVVEAEKYAAISRDQHIERVHLLPHRGRILDRHDVPLAYTVDNPVLV